MVRMPEGSNDGIVRMTNPFAGTLPFPLHRQPCAQSLPGLEISGGSTSAEVRLTLP